MKIFDPIYIFVSDSARFPKRGYRWNEGSQTDISEAEADISRLEKQGTTLTDAIGQEKEKITKLKEQASDLGRYDLTDVRLALRPQMEAQARIRDTVSSGRGSLLDFQTSVKETNSLLGEEGMSERLQIQHPNKIQVIDHDLIFPHNTECNELSRRFSSSAKA